MRTRWSVVVGLTLSLLGRTGLGWAGDVIVVHVDGDAPAGGDGTSWATAFRVLAPVLAAATSGTEIRVAEGTHWPDATEANPDGSGSRTATFLVRPGVVVRGGFAGLGAPDPDLQDPESFATVLSGDLLGDDAPGFVGNGENAYHVLTVNGAGVPALLQGVTVSGGNANTTGTFGSVGAGLLVTNGVIDLDRCRFVANRSADNGGAILSSGGVVGATSCRFEGNRGDHGTAIAAIGGQVAVADSDFVLNERQTPSYSGGSVVEVSSGVSLAIQDCHFESNGMSGGSFVIAASESTLAMWGTSIADHTGGAVLIPNSAYASIGGCTLTDNGGGITKSGDQFFDVAATVLERSGGISISGGETQLTDLRIAESGAALSVSGGALVAATACLVEDVATTTNGAWCIRVLAGATLEMTDCTVRNNTSAFNGAGLRANGTLVMRRSVVSGNEAQDLGAGIHAIGATVRLEDCEILGNIAHGTTAAGGGGIYAEDSTLEIDRCRFAENRSFRYGGAIDVTRGFTTIRDSLLAGNVSSNPGGAISNRNGIAVVESCTLALNRRTVTGDGDGIYLWEISGGVPSEVVVRNSILWSVGESEGDQCQRGTGAVALFAFCTVRGWTSTLGGPANDGLDPLFLDEVDFVPATCSPAVDSGSNALVGDDVLFDLRGLPRFADDAWTPDRGAGAAPIVDRGAIELDESIWSDCNGNGLPDACEIADGSDADCDGNGVPDSCDVASGAVPDCNANGISDACEVQARFEIASPHFAPFGDGFPATLPVVAPPPATDVVRLLLRVSADIDGPAETVDVRLDGTLLGTAFPIGGGHCGDPPDERAFTIAASTYNGLAADGIVVVELLPSAGVHADECGTSWAEVRLDYPIAARVDCDANGIPDACDPDCDDDGVPDACALDGGAPDCNGNGLPDVCDIADGTSVDCDGNGVPDDCDLAGGAPDCNANAVPDSCDIASGTSMDADGDGVPDECANDCNGNGIADDADIAQGTSDDCDGDGVPDECQPDCNGNGIADACDIAGGGSEDCDADGIPDECGTDCNGNGVADACDVADGTSPDADGDGVPDECQPDCNGNGVPDGVDVGEGTSADCNGNGTPDECDIASGASADCDANGTPDSCDIADGRQPDCDADGVPDPCAIADGSALDLDGNGVPDACQDCNGNHVPDFIDIDFHLSADCNGNEVPDECECLPDLAPDGTVGLADLVALLSAWGACDAPCAADLDCSGDVGFGDLVVLLGAWGDCP